MLMLPTTHPHCYCGEMGAACELCIPWFDTLASVVEARELHYFTVNPIEADTLAEREFEMAADAAISGDLAFGIKPWPYQMPERVRP